MRDDIYEFSAASRKRLAFVASNTAVEFVTMATLTYPRTFPVDGKESKRHLKMMIQRLRRKVPDLQYLWFMEFQKRGAPHYHMLFDCQEGEIGKVWLSRAWYEVVDSGDEKHMRAGTRLERVRKDARRYAIKYASKMHQKEVPKNYRNCGRFFGYSKRVAPQPIMEILEGDIERLYGGDEKMIEAIEKGYNTIYNSAAIVAANVIKE